MEKSLIPVIPNIPANNDEQSIEQISVGSTEFKSKAGPKKFTIKDSRGYVEIKETESGRNNIFGNQAAEINVADIF